jgi:hypothetical protein
MAGRVARIRAWTSGHKSGVAIGGGFIAASGTSAAIWSTATDGTKQADLGSSLLGGLVVGFILLLVGRQFNETARQGQANEAMQKLPDTEPEADSGDVAAPPRTSNVEVAPSDAVGEIEDGQRTFQVVYEGTQRDTSRLDAQQIRLRLFEVVLDGDKLLYTQFVTVPVPSPELRQFVGADSKITEGQLWWHVATAIEPRLTNAIQRGEIPTATPSFAYEVSTYDLRDAVRRARQDTDPEHEVKANEVVYTFRTASRSSREDELVMQIRQIVGYESDQSLVPEGEGRYKMDLHRPLTPIDEHRLEELANYNGVQIEFHHGEQRWST